MYRWHIWGGILMTTVILSKYTGGWNARRVELGVSEISFVSNGSNRKHCATHFLSDYLGLEDTTQLSTRVLSRILAQDAGADISATDSSKNTVFHNAARNGRLWLLAFFLSAAVAGGESGDTGEEEWRRWDDRIQRPQLALSLAEDSNVHFLGAC